jgi:hypothetical protein
MKDSLNIAIAGATGFVGIELIKILLKHKKVKILNLCATKSVGKNIHTFDKKLKNKNLPKISKIQDLNWERINIIFTALPDGEAQKIAALLDELFTPEASQSKLKKFGDLSNPKKSQGKKDSQTNKEKSQSKTGDQRNKKVKLTGGKIADV